MHTIACIECGRSRAEANKFLQLKISRMIYRIEATANASFLSLFTAGLKWRILV